MTKPNEPVIIKKYANRRLYNTGTSTYVTLEDLALDGQRRATTSRCTMPSLAMTLRAVCWPRSSSSRRTRKGKTFCRSRSCAELIRFYGDSMQMLVPRFLEASIDSLTKEQGKLREQMTQAFGGVGFGPMEDQVRRNMQMFERTFAMFAPFARREVATGDGRGERKSRQSGPGQARSTS